MSMSDLKLRGMAGALPFSAQGVQARHRVCSNEDSGTQPRRRNRVEKAWSSLIHLSRIKFGTCHSLCKRLEVGDSRVVYTGHLVERANGDTCRTAGQPLSLPRGRHKNVIRRR